MIDRVCAALGEVVDQVAEIDIEHVPRRDDVGEADLLRLRPVDHRRRECPRLSDEGDMSVVRHRSPEACVDPEARHHQPEAVRTEHSHTVEAGRPLGDLALERGACLAGLAEPRRQDRHGRYPGLAALIHDVRHGRRRSADHGKVGRRRGVTHARVGLHPVDGLTLRVDRVDHPLVARLEQVPQDDVSHVLGAAPAPTTAMRLGANSLSRLRTLTSGRQACNETGARTRSASSTIRVA